MQAGSLHHKGKPVAKKSKIYGHANRIFGLQNSYGGVPSNVLASARNVFADSETQQDRDTIFNYLGVKGNRAKQVGRQLKEINGPLQQLSKFSNLVTRVAAGGPDSFYAGVDLTSFGAHKVENLTRNKDVQKIVEKVADKYFGSAVKGVNFLYAARSGAQMVNANLGYAMLGYKAVRGIVTMGEALGGLNGGESLRLLQSQAYINKLEGVRADPYDRAIGRLRLLQEERNRSGADWLGFLPRGWGGKTSGEVAERIAQLETRQQLREAGFSFNADTLRDTARERMFRDRHGMLFGHLAESWDVLRKKIGLGPNADTEAAVNAQAAKNLARATELRKLMYERAAEGDVKEAEGLQKQINKELGVNIKWQCPQVYFVNEDASRGAARVFPMTQRMLRLRSYE